MSDNESVQLILDDSRERMDKTRSELANALSLVRSGRATPGLVEDIRVEAYGDLVPMNQVGNISIPEARLIKIDVWDKSILQNVEKAIQKSGRNLNPQVDGSVIRIALAELNEERRKELVKLAKQKTEDFKVAIRNIRRDANDSVKKLKGEGLSEDEIHSVQGQIQKFTDEYIESLDQMFHHKEKEIITI